MKSKLRKILISLLVLISSYAAFHMLNIKYASIDKIYIINLDGSTDRYAHMQKQLSDIELPVKYERFSAIDDRNIKLINRSTGESLTGEEVQQRHLLLKGDFDIQCSIDDRDYISGKIDWNYYHPRAMGELGHMCSSRKIWKEAVEQKYKNTFIMEDDVIFRKNFTDLLEKATDNAPKDYDVLYLNIGHFGKAYKSNVSNPLFKAIMNSFDQHFKNIFWKQARRNIRSAKAYIISNLGAEKLLECTKNLPSEEFFAADARISKCIEEGKIITYVSKPQLLYNNEQFKSEIGD